VTTVVCDGERVERERRVSRQETNWFLSHHKKMLSCWFLPRCRHFLLYLFSLTFVQFCPLFPFSFYSYVSILLRSILKEIMFQLCCGRIEPN